MGRPKVIFYSAFFLFNLLLFLFTLYVDANRSNFDVLFALQSRISQMKYFAAFGLVLAIGAYAISFYSNLSHKKELERMENKQNEYKARIFDLQEELKESESKTLHKSTPEPEVSSSSQKKASGEANS